MPSLGELRHRRPGSWGFRDERKRKRTGIVYVLDGHGIVRNVLDGSEAASALEIGG